MNACFDIIHSFESTIFMVSLKYDTFVTINCKLRAKVSNRIRIREKKM